MSAFLRSLQPTNDSQRPSFDLSSQHFGFIEQTRLLTALQQASSISWPLLDIVVAWALILFLGYGLLSKPNATVIATLVYGASLVAGAIILG